MIFIIIMQEHADERDVNDVFTDLLLSEELLSKEGYNEGYHKGASEGNVEGFHLGYHRGAEIGAELGYYLGIVESYLQNSQSEKITKNLVQLKALIDVFPRCNSEDVDIIAQADNIRTLFKKVCALLKIDSSYPESDKMTF